MSRLSIVPVVDLMGGVVVHAREGRRSQYAPVQSRLCASAQPQSVVAALLGLHGFRILYVADLDAILRRGDNLDCLAGIRRSFPQLELWVDCGIATAPALKQWIKTGIGRAVIGSESLRDADFVRAARSVCGDRPPVLSLDFVGDEFKGPPELLDEAEDLWPERVLAMNLLRVGSRSGPDVRLIRALKTRAPDREVYAAGGVRSIRDLERVAKAGGTGALIASALHDGRLARNDLARFQCS